MNRALDTRARLEFSLLLDLQSTATLTAKDANKSIPTWEVGARWTRRDFGQFSGKLSVRKRRKIGRYAAEAVGFVRFLAPPAGAQITGFSPSRERPGAAPLGAKAKRGPRSLRAI
jgi:hypothetical protein